MYLLPEVIYITRSLLLMSFCATVLFVQAHVNTWTWSAIFHTRDMDFTEVGYMVLRSTEYKLPPVWTFTNVNCSSCNQDHIATKKVTCHVESHSVTCHSAVVTLPTVPQLKLVLDLATPEGCKADLIWWWLYPKIVYPPKMITYLRDNQTVSWPEIERTTASQESKVLSTRPPSRACIKNVQPNFFWRNLCSIVLCDTRWA